MSEQRQPKSDLRQMFLERRKQIPAEARKVAARQAYDLFFKHAQIPKGAVVAGYSAIRAELDVLPILRELIKRGHPCALPHVIARDAALEFRAWDETTPMTTGKHDIAEPAADNKVLPDVLLVPLLSFDANCHRIGYGAGHYDRTIVQIKATKPVLTIGMAYEVQKSDALPVEGHDVRLDMIITDRNVYQ